MNRHCLALETTSGTTLLGPEIAVTDVVFAVASSLVGTPETGNADSSGKPNGFRGNGKQQSERTDADGTIVPVTKTVRSEASSSGVGVQGKGRLECSLGLRHRVKGRFPTPMRMIGLPPAHVAHNTAPRWTDNGERLKIGLSQMNS